MQRIPTSPRAPRSSVLWRLTGGFRGLRLLANGALSWPLTIGARILALGQRSTQAVDRAHLQRGERDRGGPTDAVCSFGALHYELGELRDISEIRGIDLNAPYVSVLRSGRAARFAQSAVDPLELLNGPLRRTLAEAGDPRDVEAVVIASDRLLHTHSYPDVSRFINRLGLGNATVIGVGLSGCTNATVALRTAAALVHTERLRRVLVVSVDTLPADREYRVTPQGTCVFSDAAVSFVVSPGGIEPFDVLAIEHERSPSIGLLDLQADTMRAIRESMAGPRAAVERLLTRARVRPRDVRQVFLANFVYGIALAQARSCGFRESQCFLDNIPRGHTTAGDPFVSLKDYVSATNADGLFVLLGSFTDSWGAVLVRRRDGAKNPLC